jgi:spore germination cell wall hydrolase CwlJ-like protein
MTISKLLFLFLATATIALCMTATKEEKKEITCLAKAIYFESRGDSFEGQVAVANVVMNRLNHWNYKSICETVYDKGQFSWSSSKTIINDKKSWKDCENLATYVYVGLIWDNTGGALFFHEPKIKPKWSKRLVKVGRIGAHMFYRVPIVTS